MLSPHTARQLALDLVHAENFARDDFLEAECNQAALHLIERWPDWPAMSLALVGPPGSGKSHLAAIWAELAGARFVAARALGEGSPKVALATAALVVEDLTSGSFDEPALFHLLNLAREEDAFLLLTAEAPLASIAIELPDLASRLRAIPTATIHAPDDALMRAVLVKQFADRQLQPDEGLISFLLTRIDRSFAAAKGAVELLDAEGLSRRRPVTRSLAAEVFRMPPAEAGSVPADMAG